MPTILISGLVYAASENLPYPPGGDTVINMVANAGATVKFVLAILLALSVACWFVIVLKWRLIRTAKRESIRFFELFRQRKNYSVLYRESEAFEGSHLAQIYRSGYAEFNLVGKSIDTRRSVEFAATTEVLLESVGRAMQGAMTAERQRFERFLPLLATTGSTAPFIGLFGTVWGIMTSFQEIGAKGAANLAVVAPGISEALIATAIGLAAAIPAVVAYNHFSTRIRDIENEMSRFSTDFLNMLERDLLRRESREESIAAAAS